MLRAVPAIKSENADEACSRSSDHIYLANRNFQDTKPSKKRKRTQVKPEPSDPESKPKNPEKKAKRVKGEELFHLPPADLSRRLGMERANDGCEAVYDWRESLQYI